MCKGLKRTKMGLFDIIPRYVWHRKIKTGTTPAWGGNPMHCSYFSSGRSELFVDIEEIASSSKYNLVLTQNLLMSAARKLKIMLFLFFVCITVNPKIHPDEQKNIISRRKVNVLE